jgi:LacI family transcriptional regulator
MVSPPSITTMADLARHVGVSPMTVSRVLSGVEGKVAAKTRERVLAEAKRHKIEVNHLARSYYSKRAWAVGVATPFEGLLGSEYFARVVRGISEEFDERKWGMVLFDTRAKSVDCGKVLDRYYRQRRVDGLFIIAPTSEDQFVRSLSDLDVPLALVGELSADLSVRCVDVDPERGMKEALECLYGLGHRRMAFIRGPVNIGSAERRWEAFCRFQNARNLPVAASWGPVSDFTRGGGRRAMLELWEAAEKPTAVFAANDLMALGCCDAARDLGIRIPEDLSLVGFDDTKDSAEASPALSTVTHPMEDVGRTAARLMKSLFEGKAGEPVAAELLPTRFMARASHGKAGLL